MYNENTIVNNTLTDEQLYKNINSYNELDNEQLYNEKIIVNNSLNNETLYNDNIIVNNSLNNEILYNENIIVKLNLILIGDKITNNIPVKYNISLLNKIIKNK